MQPCELKVGDVVQLNENNKPCWIGCFLMVTEPKKFGCQDFVAIPKEQDKPAAMAFYRPNWEQMERMDFRALGQTERFEIIACAALQPSRETEDEETA